MCERTDVLDRLDTTKKETVETLATLTNGGRSHSDDHTDLLISNSGVKISTLGSNATATKELQYFLALEEVGWNSSICIGPGDARDVIIHLGREETLLGCGKAIPIERREAIIGCIRCIPCQELYEAGK